jgi:GNAT superfamily N-acetyltransferase
VSVTSRAERAHPHAVDRVTHRIAGPSDRALLERFCRGYRLADQHAEEPEIVRASLDIALRGDPSIRIFVLLLDGEPVGYLALSIGFSIEAGGHDAFVDEIYVEEEHRSRGIGARALAMAEEECRKIGVKRLNLEVERHNTRAKSLYEREGYRDNHRFLLHKFLS